MDAHGCACMARAAALGTLAADAPCQLDVLGHDCHALGVDGGKVGVLKQPDQVGLGRLLQRQHRRRLEAQVGLEVLRDLTHQALKRQLADQQLGGLLRGSGQAGMHGGVVSAWREEDAWL